MNETPAPMPTPNDPHGATGWTPPPAWSAPNGPASFAVQPGPTPRRRRWLRTALVAVPALAVVAGASSVITLAIAGDHSTATTAAAHSSSAHAAKASHHSATVGTLTSENGSTWQVRTTSGHTVTVHLASSTKYGTKSDPSSQSAFHDGSTVKITGKVHNGSVDATRIAPDSTTTSPKD